MIIKKQIFVHKRWHLLVKITNRIASDMRIKYYCVQIEKWVSPSNVKWQITDIIKQCSCGVILISLKKYSLFWHIAKKTYQPCLLFQWTKPSISLMAHLERHTNITNMKSDCEFIYFIQYMLWYNRCNSII